MAHQTIIVLDFGSQFTQLIARRLRELSVYCEILPFNTSLDAIKAKAPIGVILSGGPSSVDEEGAPHCDRAVLDLGVPTLGICYGMQLMTDMLGGSLGRSAHREFGHAIVRRQAATESRLLKGIPDELKVWASHGDFVATAPAGFTVVATSDNAPVAVMESPDRGYYAMLFHPEVAHTDRGTDLLRNFAFDVCGCTGDWTTASFIDEATARIKAQVGSGRVVCGLSGGVDSTVAASIIHRAIGDRLQCIFVDNGLLRLNEAQQVVERYKRLALPVHHVDATDIFLTRLAGVTDPEKKRKIIGATFIDVFNEKAQALGDFDFLAQGTLYPDVIESVSVRGPSADHQEPSQRRRPARGNEVQAGGAAARAVQGRSATRRPRPGHREGIPRAPAVSGTRSRRPHSRRHHPRQDRRCCRRPMRLSRMKCARPAGTSASGRASPCCCPCRASA